MAENKEMNAKLADEELDQAAGGASKPKKKFKAGTWCTEKDTSIWEIMAVIRLR